MKYHLPVAVIRMLFHVKFAEPALFFIVWLFLCIGHGFPFGTFKNKKTQWNSVSIACMPVIPLRLLLSSFSLPKILLMLELCISGHAFRIFLLSSLAHTINAFIGLLIWGLPASFFSFWERIILAPNIFPAKISNKTPFKKYAGKWREKKRKELE